jgi:hypothetical protein
VSLRAVRLHGMLSRLQDEDKRIISVFLIISPQVNRRLDAVRLGGESADCGAELVREPWVGSLMVKKFTGPVDQQEPVLS